jgi:hypothetical protein
VAFGLLRAIGYEVSFRQTAWPPAWHELREVQARLFISQARKAYEAGQPREAISALGVAYDIDPKNYSVGMMLAQFYQAGNADMADTLYSRLWREHPAHRKETSRVWFFSLLSRGQLKDVAELARRQLAEEPEQAPAWAHALIFCARHLRDASHLNEAARAAGLKEPVRALLALAARVQNLPGPEARLLLETVPAATDFPFDRVYRIETLVRLGFADEAQRVLLASRPQLTGRDVARLGLAIYARQGDVARLEEGFSSILAPSRKLQGKEVSLLATHLVTWPNAKLLAETGDALGRLEAEPFAARLEVGLAVFCAAGVQKNRERMEAVLKQLSSSAGFPLFGMQKLESFFLSEGRGMPLESVLPQQTGLSLELIYPLLDRYLVMVPDVARDGIGK